ncbi:MAG TPA: penicillin-binding protein 1C [Polyangiaceae bacterium]
MRRISPRVRRALALAGRAAAAGALALVLGLAALAVAVFRTPLPEALSEKPRPSLRIVDRGGRLLGEVRTERGELSAPVPLEHVSPWVVPALLAAEDARFFDHPGVDPLAMARAFAQLVRAGRVVSGASTLTQQLARSVWPRPRTARGKLAEIVIALSIERSLDKQRILEEYLGRIEFGPNLRGIDAASRFYFDKPARALDLAEAAALVSIPRGPTLYDPRRGTERLERRRQRVLSRMSERSLAAESAIVLARKTPLRVARGERPLGANHLVAALASGGLEPATGSTGAPRTIETTLDASLQRAAEEAALRTKVRLRDARASAAAVIVLDNATVDVLAYVGAPDFHDARALGQNDGVRALRQPGSTLKPLVYAAAMRELGMTVASMLPDVELAFSSEQGTFLPKNYDRRAHGPVLLREALASSLNVPAVAVTNRLGVERTLAALRRAGFESLTARPGDYGVALALGDGEVRLYELARAYAMLARGGTLLRERVVRAVVDADGTRHERPAARAERVIDANIAAVIGDVLADPAARASAFGRGSALELPFPVAVKTGTSKGYRDNWAIGYTREITVAVWVGNFDGSPMVRSSGVTGAAPLFRDVMLAAMAGRTPAPLVDRTGLVELDVCTLSGEAPSAECPHRRLELFPAGSAPRERCSMHQTIAVDPENGLRAGPACRDAERRLFERYPAELLAWAADAGRPLAPEAFSPRCPGALDAADEAPVIAYPRDGARFHLDPGSSKQEIVFAARAAEGRAVRFLLDGRAVGSAHAPFRVAWTLERGRYRLEAVAGERKSEPVRFEVE